MSDRLPCQVCGRLLTVQRDGLTKPHKAHALDEDLCRGVGFRHARWPVGQRLRHHAGSVWAVIHDKGDRFGDDYVLRCEVGTGGEREGNELTVHGEYLHRDGWTAVSS